MTSPLDALKTVASNPIVKTVAKFAMPAALALEVLDGLKKYIAGKQSQAAQQQGPGVPPAPGV